MIERAESLNPISRKEALVKTRESRQQLFDALGSGEIKPQVSDKRDEISADLQTIRLRSLARKSLARINSRIASLEQIIQEQSQRTNLIRSRLEEMRALIDPTNPDPVSLSIIQKWEQQLATQGSTLRAQEPQPEQPVAPEKPAASAEPTPSPVETKEEDLHQIDIDVEKVIPEKTEEVLLPTVEEQPQEPLIQFEERIGERGVSIRSPQGGRHYIFMVDGDLVNLKYLTDHSDQAFSTDDLRTLIKSNQYNLGETIRYLEEKVGQKIFIRVGQGRKTKYQWPATLPQEPTPVEPVEEVEIQASLEREAKEKELEEILSRRNRIKELTQQGAYDQDWLTLIDHDVAKRELALNKIPISLLEVDPHLEDNIEAIFNEIIAINAQDSWNKREIYQSFQIGIRKIDEMLKDGYFGEYKHALPKEEFSVEEVALIRYKHLFRSRRRNRALEKLIPVLKMTIDYILERRK